MGALLSWPCQSSHVCAIMSGPCYSSGNSVVLLRIRAGAQPGEVVAEPELLPTLRGSDGIGAVAVHPEQTCFAVADKRREGKPIVSIYNWPGLQVKDRPPKSGEVQKAD